MSATQHAAAAPPSPVSSANPRAELPWQPCRFVQAPLSAGAVADPWIAAVSSIPYLAQAKYSTPSIVYRPPTVIQLSEATGCSVDDLAGAYNDLPIIRLSKEVPHDAGAALTKTMTQTFDAFDYLRLVPVDDTLEMATNARRARRPVADAEETFWEADYWEKLQRIKQEQQQLKDLRRQKRLAQEEKKKALNGASTSITGFPTAYTFGNTLSTTNSPSFMTPHSRQGSLSGHAADTDTSPVMANLQSAQRQKRIAKGLLRRARYNESHNPSHPQPHTTRSASLLSQNSACAPQSTVRGRTRPRSYSINSQLTDARGFQYSLSSAMSDGGHSALSDSLRTPPLLSINGVHPSREVLTTSLEMELSTSGGATKSGATTHSRNSAVANEGGTTPQVSTPRQDFAPPKHCSHLQTRKGSSAHDPTSPISCTSTRSSRHPQNRASQQQSTSASATSRTVSAGSRAPPKAALSDRAPLVTCASPPSHPSGPAGKAAVTLAGAASPPASPQAPCSTSGTTVGPTTRTLFAARRAAAGVGGASAATPASATQVLPPVSVHRKPIMKADPVSHCNPARASLSTRTICVPTLSTMLRTSTSVQKVSEPEADLAGPSVQQKSGSGPLTVVVETHPIRERGEETESMPGNVKGAKENTLNESPSPDRTAVPSNNSIAEQVNPNSPALPGSTGRQSSYGAASSATPSSPQGLPIHEASQTKSSHFFTATPSGSATPRATATTVPPSRTPTREASMSHRFERTVAVHAAMPASPTVADVHLATLIEEGQSQAPPTSTSPSLALAATQPPHAPTRAASREESAILPSSTPTPRPSELRTSVYDGSSTSASPKTGTQMTKTLGGARGGDEHRAGDEANTVLAATPSTSGEKPSHGASKPKAANNNTLTPAPKASGAAHSASLTPAADESSKHAAGHEHPSSFSKGKKEKKSAAACCTVM